ncbi:helix-turn-helix domain-containing protein [Paractinoplanes atraurantiacus]|uniref:helix-turn-helix domain-containing protein n=1 Tax=Paractinoplanes atraurantiacus TaxID=1036182 RepID=UPI000BE44817|nr:helix-turn-helix domain-containing protein [Actinoplanes atraurantiacus]
MSGDLRGFADDLRRLRVKAGITSQRLLAPRAFLSHTTVWAAERGEELPSLDVTLAIVKACGGDQEEWDRRWRLVYAAGRERAASPWPAQDVADGSDPVDAGCDSDAVTVQVARISLAAKRQIIGRIELRYSPGSHAAWGRFEGERGLDWLAAHRHRVDLTVGVGREADDRRLGFETEYGADSHWGDILITGDGAFFAWTAVRFDGDEVAYRETERVVLD